MGAMKNRIRVTLFAALHVCARGAAANEPTPDLPEPITMSADLDGDGKPEPIKLSPSGQLQVADATIDTRFPYDEMRRAWFERRAEVLRIVDVRKTDPAKQILYTDFNDGGEDESHTYLLYHYDGKALHKLIELHTRSKLTFSGNGTMRHVVDGWAACTGKSGPTAPRLEIIHRYAPKKRAMIQSKKRRIGTVRCDELAACPFVYVVDQDGNERLAGEILRDLRGRARASFQSLPLPDAPRRGLVRLRLREQKPEITHLEQIYLLVDGRPVLPLGCMDRSRPAFCQDDERETVLHPGDMLELVFDIGDVAAGTVELRAGGYYDPKY